MKKIYLLPGELRSLFSLKVIVIALFLGFGAFTSYSGNTIQPGTKVKVAPGTSTVSDENFVIKGGGMLFNQGTLVLRKNFLNANINPTAVGPGSIRFEGNGIQILSGKSLIQNLVIDNLAGVVLDGHNRVNGTLFLIDGILTLNDFHLILGPDAMIAGYPSAQRMINATGDGEVQKQFPTDFTGFFTFPLGDNFETPDFSPVTLKFVSGSFSTDNYVGINLKNEKFPDTTITENYLKRYWNISSNGTTPLFEFTLHYVPGDVFGTESQINCLQIVNGQSLEHLSADTINHILKADSAAASGTITGGGGAGLIATITGPDVVCANTLYTYITETGRSNYLWSVSSGGSIIAGGGSADSYVSVKWTTLQPQFISVNYLGSPNPAVLNITVNATPFPTVSGPETLCKNTAEVVYFTQTGMTGYVWSVSQGGEITAGQGTSQVTVTWNTPGAQNVSVNYANPNGCQAPSSTVFPVFIKDILPVSVSIVASDNGICEGTGVTFTASPVNGGANPSYQWFINTTQVGYNSPQFYCVPANNDIVKVVLTSSEICQTGPATSNEVPLVVHSLPVPTISGLTEICAGTQDVIYKTEENMSGYIWNIVSGGVITSGAGTSTIHVNWTQPGDHSLTVSYTDGNNCTAAFPTPYIVHVIELPVPIVNGKNHVCAGTTGEPYITEPGMTNYSWNISQGGTITSGNGTNEILVSWNTPGTNYVSVSYTNQAGCVSPVPTSRIVYVHVIPTPTITGSSTGCLNSVSYYSTEDGMTGYTWNVSPGGIILTGASGSHSINVLWTSAGNHFVSVNYLNGYGCPATYPTIKDVFVNGPIINGPTEVCKLAEVTYQTQTGMGSYSWSFFGGIKTAGGGTNDNFITIKWIAIGNRYVKVQFTTEGCTSTATLPVVVNNSSPSLVGPSSSCTNGISTFYTEENMLNYYWTISEGGTIIGESDTSAIQIQWTIPGSHTVTVDYDSPYGCQIMPTSISLTVYENPVPSLVGAAGPLCLDDQMVTYTTDANQLQYYWEFSNGANIVAGGGLSNNFISVKWTKDGEQFIKVNYLTKRYCTAAQPTVMNVLINPLPEPTISGPMVILLDNTGDYYTESGMFNYLWEVSPGGTIINGGGSEDDHVQVNWFETGTQSITLTYTDENGCSGTQLFYIEVTPETKSAETGSGSTTLNSGKNPIFSVYPVPNNGKFTVSIESPERNNYSVQVFNGLGAEIYHEANIQAEGTYKQWIDISTVADGIYTVVVRNQESSTSKRIHIKK